MSKTEPTELERLKAVQDEKRARWEAMVVEYVAKGRCGYERIIIYRFAQDELGYKERMVDQEINRIVEEVKSGN